jgi:hypothetical protein
MRVAVHARHALLIVLGLALAGCAKEDGNRIIGKWQAERLEVMSLKVLLGPHIEITRDALMAGPGLAIPIVDITQDGDEVTLETDALIGMTFYFVEADRMYFDLPVVGRMYYRRAPDQLIASATVPSSAGLPAVANAPPVTPPETTPVAAQALPHVQHDTESVQDRNVARALVLLKQGDNDEAVRALHEAFTLGFRDTAFLANTPAFDVLKDDVRYQALLARYGR